MNNYKVSGQIIEFFWFFAALLGFILALITKYYLKQDIHPTVAKPQATQQNEKKYESNDQLPQQHQEEKTKMNNQDQIANQAQSQASNVLQIVESKVNSQIQESRPLKIMRGIDRLLEFYLPIISVAIICIINWASYGFAVACIFLFFLSVILFNEWQIQENCEQQCAKGKNLKLQITLILGLFRFIHHVWILALYINYFVIDQGKID